MVITTTEVVKRETPHLIITTSAGIYDLVEQDGALVIQTPRPLLVQFIDRAQCEIRQLPEHEVQ